MWTDRDLAALRRRERWRSYRPLLWAVGWVLVCLLVGLAARQAWGDNAGVDIGANVTTSNQAGDLSANAIGGRDRQLESPPHFNGIMWRENYVATYTCADLVGADLIPRAGWIDTASDAGVFDWRLCSNGADFFRPPNTGSDQIGSGEILVGTGPGTGAYLPMSADASIASSGAVTVNDVHCTGCIESGEVSFDYAGSASPAGPATSALAVPDGGTTDLSSGVGSIQVMDNGCVQYRDGADVLRTVCTAIDIRAYGAKCTGTATAGDDDTDALNAAYAALPSRGGTINLCSQIKVGSTATDITPFSKWTLLRLGSDNGGSTSSGLILGKALVWQSPGNGDGVGGGILGYGSSYPNGSRIQWIGGWDHTNPAQFAVLQGRGATGLHFQGFSLVAGFGVPIQTGILFASISNLNLALNNTVEDVFLRANTTEIMRGVRLIGGVCLGGTHADMPCSDDQPGRDFCAVGGGLCTRDANNSENHFVKLHCSNISGPCITVENAQSYGNAAYNLIAGAAGPPFNYPDPDLGNTPWWTECNVSMGIGGACVTGDAARRGAFCIYGGDCTDDVNGALCLSGTQAGAKCDTDALVQACYVGGGTCRVPGFCRLGTNAGLECTPDVSNDLCPGAPPISGNTKYACKMGCGRSETDGGSISIDTALMGGSQLGVVCGISSQPSILTNVDSESAARALFTGGPGGVSNSGITLSHWRLAGGRWGPARVCMHGGGLMSKPCTYDSECAGGFCGGCTGPRRFAAGHAICVGPSTPPPNNPGTSCNLPAGSECLGTTTCQLQTTTRPECTGDGTGPELLKIVKASAGADIIIEKMEAGKGAADAGQPVQAFRMFYDPGAGNYGHMRVTNSRLLTSAADPFQVSDPTRQSFEVESVVIENGAGVYNRIPDRHSAPIWYGDDYRQPVQLSLTMIPTPNGTPTPRRLIPQNHDTVIAGVSGTRTNGTLAAFDANGDLTNSGDPTNCSDANQFARGIDGTGLAQCAQPAMTNLATFTSSDLAGKLTDETGTGKVVYSESPQFNPASAGAPFTLGANATAKVTNLDADKLDGNDSAAFATASHQHNASDVNAGTLDAHRLASGTPADDAVVVADSGTGATWRAVDSSAAVGKAAKYNPATNKFEAGDFVTGDGAGAVVNLAAEGNVCAAAPSIHGRVCVGGDNPGTACPTGTECTGAGATCPDTPRLNVVRRNAANTANECEVFAVANASGEALAVANDTVTLGTKTQGAYVAKLTCQNVPPLVCNNLPGGEGDEGTLGLQGTAQQWNAVVTDDDFVSLGNAAQTVTKELTLNQSVLGNSQLTIAVASQAPAITPSLAYHTFVLSGATDMTLTGAPTIAAPSPSTKGRTLLLENVDPEGYCATFLDESALSGSLLKLRGSSRTLCPATAGAASALQLFWNGSKWVEQAPGVLRLLEGSTDKGLASSLQLDATGFDVSCTNSVCTEALSSLVTMAGAPPFSRSQVTGPFVFSDTATTWTGTPQRLNDYVMLQFGTDGDAWEYFDGTNMQMAGPFAGGGAYQFSSPLSIPYATTTAPTALARINLDTNGAAAALAQPTIGDGTTAVPIRQCWDVTYKDASQALGVAQWGIGNQAGVTFINQAYESALPYAVKATRFSCRSITDIATGNTWTATVQTLSGCTTSGDGLVEGCTPTSTALTVSITGTAATTDHVAGPGGVPGPDNDVVSIAADTPFLVAFEHTGVTTTSNVWGYCHLLLCPDTLQ